MTPGPDECRKCAWRLDQDGVCTNPSCEDGIVSSIPAGRDTAEPSQESKRAAQEAAQECEAKLYNRAERRGNAIGRHRKHVPRRPPIEMKPDSRSEEERINAYKAQAKVEADQHARIATKRRAQKAARKRSR